MAGNINGRLTALEAITGRATGSMVVERVGPDLWVTPAPSLCLPSNWPRRPATYYTGSGLATQRQRGVIVIEVARGPVTGAV